MSDFCSLTHTVDNASKRYCCPVNGKRYKHVSLTTVLHNVADPWQLHNENQDYYFCDDPKCDVVYFGQDDSVITTSALRTPVGVKQKPNNATLCYCFGVTRDAFVADPKLKAFVMKKTKEKQCACDIRNPSGRCCLKEFPKL